MNIPLEEGLFCAGCMERVADFGQCLQCSWDDTQHRASSFHLPLHHLLLNRYHIGRAIHENAVMKIYLARDLMLDRLVAINEYLPYSYCSRSPDGVTLDGGGQHGAVLFQYGLKVFLKEAALLASLEPHPNICSVADFFEANNTAYWVMPYIEGVSLKKYLEDLETHLSLQTSIDLMMPVLDALREIHQNGHIHGDLTPGKVMITPKGVIRVLCFGAVEETIANHEAWHADTILTLSNYVPPERYGGGQTSNPSIDVYAAGAVLYHCITGKAPLSAPERMSADDLTAAILPPDVSPIFDAIQLKALALRPENRFQTIEALQQALLSCPTSAPSRASLPSSPPPAPVAPPPVVPPPPLPTASSLPTQSEIVPPVLFNSRAVTIATVFGGPLGGSALMSINYRRLHNIPAAWKSIGLGCAATLAIVALGFLVPETDLWKSIQSGIAIGSIVAMSQIARSQQGAAIEAAAAEGGKRGSYWASFGIGMLALFIVVALYFGAAFMQTINVTSITVGDNDKVIYSAPATKQEAEALGRALKDDGFFLDKGFVVRLSHAGGATTISFTVHDGAWDDPHIVSAFEQIGHDVAPSVGGVPITILMQNTSGEVQKRLLIQ